MYREERQASRVCSKRVQERAYSLHRRKLAGIRPSIDNKTPTMYPHLYQKLKKAQREEELCSEIERDNRTLVKRMTEIMQRPGIDTHNALQAKSLNRESRKRELLRITQENQKLLRRIQSRQPTYNHLLWEQERERSETLCERICRYPYRPRAAPERDMYYYDGPQASSSQPYDGQQQQQQQGANPYTDESPAAASNSRVPAPPVGANEAAKPRQAAAARPADDKLSDVSESDDELNDRSQSGRGDTARSQPEGSATASPKHRTSSTDDNTAAGSPPRQAPASDGGDNKSAASASHDGDAQQPVDPPAKQDEGGEEDKTSEAGDTSASASPTAASNANDTAAAAAAAPAPAAQDSPAASAPGDDTPKSADAKGAKEDGDADSAAA
ncbi:hypothetical protein DIPPA_07349 [Diplonema papillatum]|nr:hypothetical protein DIPPA_07349 [Diplonema papillatum]|eukprot:gene13481-20773_t